MGQFALDTPRQRVFWSIWRLHGVIHGLHSYTGNSIVGKAQIQGHVTDTYPISEANDA